MTNERAQGYVAALSNLAADVRRFLEKDQEEWDERVTGERVAGTADLWADMPTVDSKTVARMSPIFEKHLGRPLAIRRIRHGGYGSIDDVIQHLPHLVFGKGDP